MIAIVLCHWLDWLEGSGRRRGPCSAAVAMVPWVGRERPAGGVHVVVELQAGSL